MTLRRKLLDVWATGKSGVAIATLLGLLILLLRTPLERWSYDLPYLIRPQATISEVAIVHLDDVSHQALNQPYDGAWDRTNHAELVEVLTEAGARAIAFDILFNDEGRNPAANLKFANAVRKNGKVVLASDLGTGDYYAYAIDLRPMLPNSTLLAATPYYGFDQLMPDPDDCIRRHLHDVATIQSLSWSLATMLNAEVTKHPGSASEERWLNYYGPRDTIPHLSYAQALNRNDPAVKDFFRNRVVFIGSATASGFSGKRRDQFRTPFSTFSEPLWPGVNIHATMFLNLLRGDWLTRVGGYAEMGLMVLGGLLSGIGVSSLKPKYATYALLGVAVLVTLLACLLAWYAHYWFAWLVIVAVQMPIGVACSLARGYRPPRSSGAGDLTADFDPGSALGRANIPDYELLRRIGSGSYGDVWLARNVTGTWRAVKIVDQKNARDVRFEREFAGLKKFEPVSRAHEGLVDILHVGHNPAAGQFYYVMELADSCSNAPKMDVEGYVPCTLKSKLQAERGVSADECLHISQGLTSALSFLHQQGLLHRDIKPSNIIFVGGQPKLADIGLVAGADETKSFVGTEGYIPPEGPGTPGADVFSLGKVLNELAACVVASEESKVEGLKRIIERACARTLQERYANAIDMLKAFKSANPE